jgi:hypothetical protein
MQNLNQGILLNMPIGLPPEQEQARIVERVDALMTQCDQLTRALPVQRTTREVLLESLLNAALDATSRRNTQEVLSAQSGAPAALDGGSQVLAPRYQ